MDKREMIINNPKLEGQVGENAVWDGPLSKKGFPMGNGSSSGITGLEVSKDEPFYKAGPITMKAKGKGV
jgi:hypothetical protein